MGVFKNFSAPNLNSDTKRCDESPALEKPLDCFDKQEDDATPLSLYVQRETTSDTYVSIYKLIDIVEAREFKGC